MRRIGRIERVGTLAEGQCGRVTVAQLQALDVHRSTMARWTRNGYLRPILPRVYAVGHAAPSREADLWAAVLYAGPGAMLSHGTAAHRRTLIDYAPPVIQVSTKRDVRSLKGIKVYGRRRELVREFHRGIPVTSIPLTMVDLAASGNRRVVDRALGQLDFQKLLDVTTLLDACGSGARGSALLRAAIEDYDPRRKYANGRLEEDFLELCRQRGLPLPVLNTYVHDIKCDAYWPAQGLVVELDSELAHNSAPQRRRDRRNDLRLRGHGLTVLRYDWDLVHERAEEVCADVLRMLERLVEERRRRSA
jgi:very-short-patch-repair endonuclease